MCLAYQSVGASCPPLEVQMSDIPTPHAHGMGLKNGTSGVHGGGYFAPHDTNNNFWVLDFIYVRSTRAPTDDPSLT
jgi:hypothetical protein